MSGAQPFGKISRDPAKRTWWIECEPHVMTRLKRIFERIPKSAQGKAPLADSPGNARELSWFILRFPMEMSPEDAAYLTDRAESHREKETIVQRMLEAGYVPAEYAMAVPPREYQRFAADLCLQRGSVLCADELGTGKSWVGACVIADPRARPALIICPTHLPQHWVRVLERTLPDLRVHVLKKGKPYDLTKGPRGKTVPMPDVVISNYHKLHGWAQTLAGVVRSVIADEAHEFRHEWADTAKTARTCRYEAMLHLRDRVPYRLFLTATPIFNYGGEMRNVLNAMEEDVVGNAEEFGREWCGGMTGEKAPVEDPRALGAHLRREGIMLRRTRAEVGREIPALTRTVQPVEMRSAALENVSARVAELAKVLVQRGGLGEIKMKAGAEIDWRLRRATGVDKAPFCADFIRMLVESSGPVLAFAWHRDVYSVLEDSLRDLNPVFYTGEESPKQKEAARESFVTGKSKVMVMSLRAGQGLDGLQEVCSNVVIVELDWSPAVIDQCIGRLHRDGQKAPVFAHIMLADEGSDPIIADVLGIKREQYEGLVNPEASDVERLQGAQSAHALLLAEAYLAKYDPTALANLKAAPDQLALPEAV